MKIEGILSIRWGTIIYSELIHKTNDSIQGDLIPKKENSFSLDFLRLNKVFLRRNPNLPLTFVTSHRSYPPLYSKITHLHSFIWSSAFFFWTMSPFSFEVLNIWSSAERKEAEKICKQRKADDFVRSLKFFFALSETLLRKTEKNRMKVDERGIKRGRMGKRGVNGKFLCVLKRVKNFCSNAWKFSKIFLLFYFCSKEN